MKVTLLGTGCTFGLPKPGCDCKGCEWARANGFERKRFSCLVESNGKKLLIDAGPDLRRQMLEYGFSKRDLDAVIITHAHYDHYAGLGELRSFNKATPLYCLPETAAEIRSEFEYLSPAFIEVNEKKFGERFDAAGFKATLFNANHGRTPCAGALLEAEGKRVIALPDTHLQLPAESEALIRNADLAIVDGYAASLSELRTTLLDFLPPERVRDEISLDKFTHALLPESKEMAKRLCVKKAVTVHMTHCIPLQEELEREYGEPGFRIGFDGMQIEL